MNTLKNTTLVVILMLVSSYSFGQGQNRNQSFDPEEIIEKRISKIQNKLGLDDLQAVMVKNILVKYTKEKIELRNLQENRSIKIEKFKKITNKQTEELSKVLSEEQLNSFKELEKEWSKKRGYQGKRRKRN